MEKSSVIILLCASYEVKSHLEQHNDDTILVLQNFLK